MILHKELNNLNKFIENYKINNIYVAFSGGSDSTALFSLVNKIDLYKIDSISAIHINHQINKSSNFWEDHCSKQAKNYNIKIFVYKLFPSDKQSNIENWARNNRYQIFDKILMKSKNNLLLTGHNLEDNVETIIMNMIRGTGIIGLSGIPYFRKLSNGYLFRPLLKTTKYNIINYCVINRLSWIEDESNLDNSNKRSAIRNNILPLLKKIYANQNISKNIQNTSQLCYESNIIINKYLNKILNQILIDMFTINIIEFKRFSILERKHVLYLWLKNHKITILQKTLNNINSIILQKNLNFRININKNHKIIIQYEKIYLKNIINIQTTPKIKIVYEWIIKKNIKLKKNMIFNNLILRKRRSSDKCKPQYRNKNNILKIIFQEKKIIQEDRLLSWIVCLKSDTKKILAVYPLFVCDINLF